MLKSLLTISSLLLVAAFSSAQALHTQSRSDLEKKRMAIQKEISNVKRSLDEAHKNRRQTMDQLTLLQRNLQLRESAIQNISSQINLIRTDMNTSGKEIGKLRRELDTLRMQYAESITFAYKNRSNYDFLNFIFSAASFNDALNRIEYLKSYRAYREERAANILRTRDLLQGRIDGLKTTNVEQDEALKKENKERETLEMEKKEKDEVVTKLKSHEKELKKEMAAKQAQDLKLDKAITAVIRRAREAAMIEEKKKVTADRAVAASAKRLPSARAASRPGSKESPGPVAKSTPVKPSSGTVFISDEDMHLTDDFEKNQGRLPWPVSGTISMAYGLHEYISNVKHFNIGITIDAGSGASVKAVFNGRVQAVLNVGDSKMVMIRHGKYFTTYANLSTVSVSKGDPIGTGQIIGQVAGPGSLDFILSDEKDNNFDPAKWLKR